MINFFVTANIETNESCRLRVMTIKVHIVFNVYTHKNVLDSLDHITRTNKIN